MTNSPIFCLKNIWPHSLLIWLLYNILKILFFKTIFFLSALTINYMCLMYVIGTNRKIFIPRRILGKTPQDHTYILNIFIYWYSNINLEKKRGDWGRYTFVDRWSISPQYVFHIVLDVCFFLFNCFYFLYFFFDSIWVVHHSFYHFILIIIKSHT